LREHISCECSPASTANTNEAYIISVRTSTSFQLLYGRLSDIFSRKTVLLGCIFIFFVGSLAASLAQTATQIIAFRALTGVGGGGLMTLAQTIVSDVVTLRERLVSFFLRFCALLADKRQRGKYQGILVGSDPVRRLVVY
jgi:MFS family permease